MCCYLYSDWTVSNTIGNVFASQFERSEVNMRHSCLSNIRGWGDISADYQTTLSKELYPEAEKRSSICISLFDSGEKCTRSCKSFHSFMYWIKTLFWLVNLKLEYIYIYIYIYIYRHHTWNFMTKICNVNSTFEIYSKMKWTLFNWLLK